MSDSEVVTDAPVSQPSSSFQDKTLGRVKWFNNKVGYGFITTCDDEQKDVFVHHSNIHVQTHQYKYLVEGEYVHFTLSDSTNTEHKHLATEVSGINGGKLMCETRHLHNQERNNVEDAEESSSRGIRRKKPNNRRSHNPQQRKLVRPSQEESQQEV